MRPSCRFQSKVGSIHPNKPPSAHPSRSKVWIFFLPQATSFYCSVLLLLFFSAGRDHKCIHEKKKTNLAYSRWTKGFEFFGRKIFFCHWSLVIFLISHPKVQKPRLPTVMYGITKETSCVIQIL